MWRHHEAYIEVKQSNEEPAVTGCTYENLDHFASRVKWFSVKYLREG